MILQKGHQGFTEIALVSILVNTVGTAFFAFLPDVLANIISDAMSWRVSCGIYGVYHIYFMLRHLSLAQEFREMSFGLLGMVVGSVVAIILKLSIAAGFLLESAYVIYYAALIWSLCIAVFFFVTLLLEANAESDHAGDV